MIKNILLIIVMLIFISNFSGCIFLAAGAAGTGTVVWLSDKVTQEVNSPMDKVTRSTRAVLKDMEAIIYKETNASDFTQILAKDSNGKQIWVDLHPLGPRKTKIDVRVGYLNGENDARKILERIVNKANSWV